MQSEESVGTELGRATVVQRRTAAGCIREALAGLLRQSLMGEKGLAPSMAAAVSGSCRTLGTMIAIGQKMLSPLDHAHYVYH